jgi:hypothetical protein
MLEHSNRGIEKELHTYFYSSLNIVRARKKKMRCLRCLVCVGKTNTYKTPIGKFHIKIPCKKPVIDVEQY